MGIQAYQHSAQRVTNQHVRWLHIRSFQQRIQIRDGERGVVQPLGHERGLAIARRGADNGQVSMPRVQSTIEAFDEMRLRHEVGPSYRDQ